MKLSTINFYHGGVESDFTKEQIDVYRKSEKQQNRNNSYVGFYMYGEENFDDAVNYANQENERKNTTTKGVVKVTMPSNVRIFPIPDAFSITRMTAEKINILRQMNFDIAAGSVLGKVEYVLLNKDLVLDVEFIPITKKNKKSL